MTILETMAPILKVLKHIQHKRAKINFENSQVHLHTREKDPRGVQDPSRRLNFCHSSIWKWVHRSHSDTRGNAHSHSLLGKASPMQL